NLPDPSYQRIGVIGDGSCFFHVIAKVLAPIYQLTYNKYSIVSEKYLQTFEDSILRYNLFDSSTFNPVRFSRQQVNIHYTIINQSTYEKSMQTFRSVFIQLLRGDIA